MAESGQEVLRRYLQDSVAAAKGFETELRSFSRDDDDAEVQAVFLRHAELTKRQHETLTARLRELGGGPSATKGFLAHLFTMSPRAVQLTHRAEERTSQNLIMAFTIGKSGRAMCEALSVVARTAGDLQTERLARELGDGVEALSEVTWRLLPSRSKIAFNILTAGEVDPSVETKSPDDRLVDTTTL